MSEQEWAAMFNEVIRERDDFHLKMCEASAEAARFEAEIRRLRELRPFLTAAEPSAALEEVK